MIIALVGRMNSIYRKNLYLFQFQAGNKIHYCVIGSLIRWCDFVLLLQYHQTASFEWGTQNSTNWTSFELIPFRHSLKQPNKTMASLMK